MSKSTTQRVLSNLIPNIGTVLIVALMLLTYPAWAAPEPIQSASGFGVSNTISYQGNLTDASGQPITGDIDMIFRLYDVETGGTELWSEGHMGVNAVPVQNGLFHLPVGSLNPIPAEVWNQPQLYLGIQVATDPEMTPREVVGVLPAAYVAQTVPDASITTAKLHLDSALDMNGQSITNLMGINVPFRINADRSWMFRAYDSGMYTKVALQSLSDNKSFLFTTQDDSVILAIQAENSSGGYLDMNGHPIYNVGAVIEANLQTPDQMASETIADFSEGEVLCWDGVEQLLVRCSQQASPLVVAVADSRGKPIILGAEVINVLGPVLPGDLLVSSNRAGYAVAWTAVGSGEPPMGVVIAKALAGCDQFTCQIKALIFVR